MTGLLSGVDRLVPLVVSAVVVVRLALALQARLHRPTRATGDAELAAVVDRHAGWRTHAVVALAVEPGSVRSAYVAATPTTRFELGSVSKVFTALLTADAIDRDLLRGGTTLGELLPLGTAPAAAASVDELVTHTSGLPRLPTRIGTLARTLAFAWFGTNPYRGLDREAMLAATARTRLADRRPHPRAYSNLGVALLGHAVAAAEATSYDAAVRSRILDPLAMADTEVATRDRPVSRGRRGGLRPSPWASTGYAPAAGVTSTPQDMARFAEALVDRTVAGLETSLAPRDPQGSALLWARGRAPGSVWHNGETGGYAAYVSLSRSANPYALVLLADSAPVEGLMEIARDLHRLLDPGRDGSR